MTSKSCFVIMPIRKAGTPEFAHFRAVYNQIKPVIDRVGYSVSRADDVQKSGAITKDIVTRLGDSDLVIADLTDLNPNVFYELGVRHALRGKGTVMIIDEMRTSDIPFDLGAYRVIKYTGELTGIEALSESLQAFITEANEAESPRDNPVHDWFPELPINALESATKSDEAPLRKTIKELRERIDQYEKAYGTKLSKRVNDSSPLALVQATLTDAADGLLAIDVIESARQSFEKRDVLAFLKKIQALIEREVRLPATTFLALIRYASVLDLNPVVRALFEQALQFYPSDENLRRSYLGHLAHSDVPEDRSRARKEIGKEITLEVGDNTIEVGDHDELESNLGMLGVLLDSYHSDNLDRDALRICEKMVQLFPGKTMVLRSLARALEEVGKGKEAMSAYRMAIFAPDVDDTSAVWLGNQMHNIGKHAAAAEAYAFGCLLDPADAKIYAHLADELTRCIAKRSSVLGGSAKYSVHQNISADTIVLLAHCAASCNNIDAEVSERLRNAFSTLEVEFPTFDESLQRSERVASVLELYGYLKTGLTTTGAPYDFTPDSTGSVTNDEANRN